MIFNSRKLRKVLVANLLAAGMSASSASAGVFETSGQLINQVTTLAANVVKVGCGLVGFSKVATGVAINAGAMGQNDIQKVKSTVGAWTKGCASDVQKSADYATGCALWNAEIGKDGEVTDNKIADNVKDLGVVSLTGGAAGAVVKIMEGMSRKDNGSNTVIIKEVQAPQPVPMNNMYQQPFYGPMM